MNRDSGEEAHCGSLWKVMGNEQIMHGMWEYFTLERAGARTIPADAARGKQEGMQDQWQQESLLRSVLEQVKRSADADCGLPNDALWLPPIEEW